ncbi:unnamed protein product [Caenorhabditis angaria]|uniref:Uncharacterized protein n=1 Tax=Caenorhabditis angaria TaxID=860376 RepID=A0A9P1IYW1_9PELO|nr:unnamed protein product [Caenorhabditis angaria]
METEKEIKLDETNEALQFLIENAATKDPKVQAEFVNQVRNLNDQIGAYQWAQKKRFGFDESSWRHMAKRMTMLKNEGFDCRPNTRKAKEKKAACDNKESHLEQFFLKKKPKTKKKKGPGEA